MLEKLSEYKITNRDGSFINADCNTKIINTLVRKINELVDAVNGILDYAPLEMAMKAEPKIPADPYTEQRKWIGKLCKFWFADAENSTFGILDFVDAGPHPEPFHINCGESEQGWYPHCEPVKPDDDIIYKGE